jgi:hypothetical protein
MPPFFWEAIQITFQQLEPCSSAGWESIFRHYFATQNATPGPFITSSNEKEFLHFDRRGPKIRCVTESRDLQMAIRTGRKRQFVFPKLSAAFQLPAGRMSFERSENEDCRAGACFMRRRRTSPWKLLALELRLGKPVLGMEFSAVPNRS